MAVNDATLALVKESEGWRAKSYPDPATGGEPITIGYGHTSAAGAPAVKLGMAISKAEGETILIRDLARVEALVRRLVKVPVDENQFGALVSLAFNIGDGNFADSTLLRKLNAGDYLGAAGQFRVWVKAGRPRKTMPGLVTRRAKEAALFSLPVAAQPVPDHPTPPEPERPASEQPTAQHEPFRPDWWKIGLFAAVLGLAAFTFLA